MSSYNSQEPAAGWHRRRAALTLETRLFIGGEFVPARGGARMQTIDPSTGEVIAEVSQGGVDDIDRAVRAGRSAFRAGAWRRMRPRDRKEVLLRLAELVQQHADTFALIDSIDMGKPIGETTTLDVPIAIRCIRFYAEAIDKVGGDVTTTASDVLHYVLRQPLGVVGCIIPWNYPLMMAAWKIAPALAAGNSVVLKPAEQSPLSALLLARLFSEAGGPAGVLNVVNGLGPQAGKALALHADVDKIAFTGSVEVGKLMMVYAGQSNMKRVSTECGGKSPQIVMDDAENLDFIARQAAIGVYENQGQVCSAGSRLYVHRRHYDEFVERFADWTRRLFRLGDPLDPTTTMGPLVTAEQQQRVLGYIEIGKAEGARLAFGGKVPERLTRGAYVEPTLFLDAHDDMRIVRQEIFGPVAAILPFEDFEDALARANDSIYGLAAAIWTRDVRRAHLFARDIEAGVVWLNCFDKGDMTAPWGGFKQSGFGRDKGLEALEQYTQSKSVWLDLSVPQVP
jgi:acyl-CoA reductase-like NAD-dependent aldehyde dehydrogenase